MGSSFSVDADTEAARRELEEYLHEQELREQQEAEARKQAAAVAARRRLEKHRQEQARQAALKTAEATFNQHILEQILQQVQGTLHKIEMAQKQNRPLKHVQIIPNPSATHGFELMQLLPQSSKYREIHDLFKSTGKWYMNVQSIQQITNPLQEALYALKKNEVKAIYNVSSYTTIEQNLFHGTLECNLTSICKTNLDRRRCTHHKFGQGVSFTPISFYASHYCGKGPGNKVMLLCKVITVQAYPGNVLVKVPPDGYDHTQNPKGHVIVKYDDDTYYPEYIIRYNVKSQRNPHDFEIHNMFQNLHLYYNDDSD